MMDEIKFTLTLTYSGNVTPEELQDLHDLFTDFLVNFSDEGRFDVESGELVDYEVEVERTND